METIFLPGDAIRFEPHPRFQGVSLAKLVTKAQDQGIGVSILAIEPGVTIPVHTHDPEVDSIYFLEGEGEAFVNGEWQRVKAGDYLCIPKRVEHGVRNIGQKILKLFVVHSPALM